MGGGEREVGRERKRMNDEKIKKGEEKREKGRGKDRCKE